MDFCRAALGTTVNSSQVSSDGYEVTNLISSNSGLKARGFLAERFVKPPVDIFFELPCPVELQYVILSTSVGAQRSVGIDLCSITIVKQNAQVAATASHNVRQDNTSVEESHQITEHILGKCILKPEHGSNVCFVNRMFRIRPPFSHIDLHQGDRAAMKTEAMRCKDWFAVSRCQKVKVRIWRTENGNVPAMGSVSIFGIPSRGVPKDVVDKIFKTLESTTDRFVLGHQKEHDKREEHSTNSEDDVPVRLAIPDEFLDPLTFEIMKYPVILPSGNTVDQTTIDRHCSNEAAWGRLPSDPFTGLSFSTERRCLPNLTLKSRIDQFILKNDHPVSSSGRTIGKRKRPIYDVYSTTQLDPPGAAHSSTTSCDKFLTHEGALKDSLESALHSTLSGLRSYTRVVDQRGNNKRLDHWTEQMAASPKCAKCAQNLQTELMYKMPCSHMFCRKCAIDNGMFAPKQKCPRCFSEYSSADIERVHL